MGQRLSRAKAKISAAGIPFKVPDPEDLPDRLNSVLTVVYLIFNAGYTVGPSLDRDLCVEAIFLARMLNLLQPGEAEVEGCLALLLITHARRAARLANDETVALTDQDRSLWDMPMLAEGLAILDAAMGRRAPGPFQIKAAIAACQSQSPPDWPQIAALYMGLYRYEPTPIIHLNQTVAMAEAGHLQVAIAALQALADPLADYQPYHAACAEYLGRAGQTDAALAAYERAIDMAASPADAAFLTRRRASLTA
jgi:predicted RNA polymerase sigma factor